MDHLQIKSPRKQEMDFVPAEGRTDDFRLPPSPGKRKKLTHLGVLCDSVVNIFYPIIAIPADVSEDVPYVIIFMKARTKSSGYMYA